MQRTTGALALTLALIILKACRPPRGAAGDAAAVKKKAEDDKGAADALEKKK